MMGMSYIFDSHAHYDDEQFDEDRETLLLEMKQNGVGGILNMSSDYNSMKKTVELTKKYGFIYGALGIHPENADEYNEDYQIIRANASSFVMNSLGYVVCGDNSTTVWQYNPGTDLWTEKTALEASGRIDAIGLAINNKGYVMLGRSGTSYFDDLWEFKPNDEQVDND